MMHTSRVRRPKKRKAKSKRDAYAMVDFPPQAPVSSYLPYDRYKILVREQIHRFSSKDLSPDEVMKIVESNDARVKAAWERGIPSRRVAKSLMP